MFMLVNSVQGANVYGTVVETVFESKTFLQDGLTFNGQGNLVGGNEFSIPVTKLGSRSKPKKSGSKFTHSAADGSVITLLANNSFMKSTEIQAVEAVAVPYDLGASKLEEGVIETKLDRECAVLAYLAAVGTASTDTTAIGVDGAIAAYDSAKKTLGKSKIRGNVCLCSWDFYTAFKNEAKEKFTPVTNERLVETGNIGMYDGTYFACLDQLTGDTVNDIYTYINASGVAVEVDCSGVDFILYEGRHLHIVDNLVAVRLVDATDFVGAYAQCHINSGFVIADAKCALVKKTEPEEPVEP